MGFNYYKAYCMYKWKYEREIVHDYHTEVLGRKRVMTYLVTLPVALSSPCCSQADSGMNDDSCPICCKVFGAEVGHCFFFLHARVACLTV